MAQPLSEAKSLPQPPTDGITALAYLPPDATTSSSSLVASTSWDGSVRIHDTHTMTLVTSHFMEAGPLLSLAVVPPPPKDSSSSSVLVTGGLDGSVRKFDSATSTVSVMGKHTGSSSSTSDAETSAKKVGCSCLVALQGPYEGLVGSAGWDGMFHLWDSRTTTTTTTSSEALASITLPGKAFSMDYDPTHHRIVVACAGRKMVFLDVKSNSNVENVLERESSLKYQTRTVQFFPDGSGIAVGSIEGRVAVEFLDDLGISIKGMKKYAFKCHRDGDVVYPVNTIAFHPQYGTFATGGCDGTVVTWDGLHKKKLTTLPKFTTSVAVLAYNHDGSELAIASSYTFEEGERDHPRDEIYVRKMLESECKPKQVSS